MKKKKNDKILITVPTCTSCTGDVVTPATTAGGGCQRSCDFELRATDHLFCHSVLYAGSEKTEGLTGPPGNGRLPMFFDCDPSTIYHANRSRSKNSRRPTRLRAV